MTTEHPNVSIIKKFDPADISAAKDILAEDAILHYFNPLLPDLAGDYVGFDGFQAFFEAIGKLTRGTFEVCPISITPAGDELVVAHTRNSFNLENQKIETNVVVVWRIVDGKISEFWDIPSVHSGAKRV